MCIFIEKILEMITCMCARCVPNKPTTRGGNRIRMISEGVMFKPGKCTLDRARIEGPPRPFLPRATKLTDVVIDGKKKTIHCEKTVYFTPGQKKKCMHLQGVVVACTFAYVWTYQPNNFQLDTPKCECNASVTFTG